jgi:hypothetical protein
MVSLECSVAEGPQLDARRRLEAPRVGGERQDSPSVSDELRRAVQAIDNQVDDSLASSRRPARLPQREDMRTQVL